MRLLLRVQGTAGDLLYTDGSAITLTDRETGERLRYLPGLVVTEEALARSLSFLSDDGGPRRMAFEVVAPGSLTIVGIGEVSRLLDDGDNHADREAVARGPLTDIVVDVQKWSAVIEEDVEDDRGLLLDELAAVGPTTWPRNDTQRAADGDPAYVSGTVGFDPRTIGVPYPKAIGYPGLLQSSYAPVGGIYQAATIGGPGLVVEVANAPSGLNATDTTIVVSDEWVNATHVQHTTEDGATGVKTTTRLPVELIHDVKGRQVSAITPTAYITIDAEHWIAWDRADGGGIADPYSAAPVLRRMDSVIQWALDRSTLRIDRSMLHHLAVFRGLQVDTVLTAQVRPWEWLTSQVLPLIPVSVVHGPRGMYLWPWVPALTSLDCSAEFEVGRNCRRTDQSWQVVPQSGVSRVTVAYGLDARSGALAGRWTLAGRRLPTDDRTTTGLDMWASRVETNRPGDSRAGLEAVVDAPIICDTTTAQQIARMQVQVSCRPQWLGQFSAAQDNTLLPGSLVRVIDSDMGLDAVAQIEAVRYTDGVTCIYDVRAWAGAGQE